MFEALVAQAKQELGPLVKRANDLVNTIGKADQPNILAYQAMDDPNTEDPTIKAYQEFKAKIEKALDDKTEEVFQYVRSLQGEDEVIDVPALTSQYEEVKGQVKAVFGALKAFMPAEEFATLTGTDEFKVLSLTGKATSGSQTGVKRPRITEFALKPATGGEWREAFVPTTKDGVTTKTVSFTAAAQWINKNLKDSEGKAVTVKSSDLREAAFAAAGTTSLSDKAGEPIEFAHEIGGIQYLVSVIPADKDEAKAEEAATPAA